MPDNYKERHELKCPVGSSSLYKNFEDFPEYIRESIEKQYEFQQKNTLDE